MIGNSASSATLSELIRHRILPALLYVQPEFLSVQLHITIYVLISIPVRIKWTTFLIYVYFCTVYFTNDNSINFTRKYNNTLNK